VRLISGIVANCRGCFDGTLFGRRTSWLNNGGLWCDGGGGVPTYSYELSK
jgi:hypothetical protein